MLHKELVAALTHGSAGDEYRFDPATRPYAHQVEAWRHLIAPDARSAIITSGTGSGKTECFLVPMLDDLARSAAPGESGVRAIMLYPLNALIASQQERLRRWTAPFAGRIRFGLYNGLTPENVPEHDRALNTRKHPEQVVDRTMMRARPPQVLVTNVTMLEYMTVRKEDRPLLTNSAGKLRWIVIDEAHSYIGSAAAEIALLLRRVLLAFGVAPNQVRFVATSATIGGSDDGTRRQLARFLADLAGVAEDSVRVVEGRRTPVALPPAREFPLTEESLCDKLALASKPAVQDFIRAAESGPVAMAEAVSVLLPTGLDPVRVIEAVAEGRSGSPLLPLRIHQFMRAVPGLWSCLNPACTGSIPESWPFGSLAFAGADACAYCSSPVFEVTGCRDCGEPFLAGFEESGTLRSARTPVDEDEFAAASEGDDAEPEDDALAARPSTGRKRLIATRPMDRLGTVPLDPTTGVLHDRGGEGIPGYLTRLNWDGSCPCCHAEPRNGTEDATAPFRFGAPFLIGNATPVVLEGVPAAPPSGRRLPADGRQVLSFTDSRQGTARFAANIETNAERSYVRGVIYHLAQKAAQTGPESLEQTIDLKTQIAALEPIAPTNSTLADLLSTLRDKLERSTKAAQAGVQWADAARSLAQDPIVLQWMREVWQDRDARFRRSAEDFAEFLLLRELARRPRRANSVETLGLAQLRFEQIEKLDARTIPDRLSERGCTIGQWRDFLYLLINTPVRSSFALDVVRENVRWLLPRGGIRRNIIGPGRDRDTPSDLVWPQSRPNGSKSAAVTLLEHLLGFDSGSAADRAELNEVLQAAWDRLVDLFETSGGQRSLNLRTATIAPVGAAWICPVTRRVLTRLAFGRSPYGHRENSPFAGQKPNAVQFPILPTCFPETTADQERIRDWLRSDSAVVTLRTSGIWNNLHDRAALLSPYVRAEEHSAQQPPDRLRAFEAEFKRGEINMLACSTTMEMGVDIGAVSAVMMTNVPPSIANYRQRVGRAGRRRQGFASSLTLARATPLDIDTFLEPGQYLRRQIHPPRVKLDAPRIVQRHVNALLLATWFDEAKGQLLKMKVGPFFGLAEGRADEATEDCPANIFSNWLVEPSHRAKLEESLHRLTAGTALEQRPALYDVTRFMFQEAAGALRLEWKALQAELEFVPSSAAQKSVERQLRRLCQEMLLKELANRALLPGHGFPTSVVPFINESRTPPDRKDGSADRNTDTARQRRYDYPSRNADIALREYAPGAEVVIDGLVWRSAGLTLNWQQPAHQEAVAEIQSLRFHWRCSACGAADCSRTMVEHCPACKNAVRQRRFIEPAGFRVDWTQEPHADTERVQFIEPEPVQVSVRRARWDPLMDPALGRYRSSHEGLVFYESRGAGRQGYRVCLACGRAEEDRGEENPLKDHTPLWGGKSQGLSCVGANRPFTVTAPIALGYELQTDVAELQPAKLDDPGGAWAFAAALREALARGLGIEAGELGLSVETRRGALEQPTHSIFLFDKNAGGAGFASRLFDDLSTTLEEARRILHCRNPGCDRGCPACVLVADLFRHQETVNRHTALECVDHLLAGMSVIAVEDMALPDARLARPVADTVARMLEPETTATLYAADAFDVAALASEPFASVFQASRRVGGRICVALPSTVMARLNTVERVGLRDASLRHGFDLLISDPMAASNGATLIATLKRGTTTRAWYSRDRRAAILNAGWGIGVDSPVAQGTLAVAPEISALALDELLPKPSPGSRVLEIEADSGRSLLLFGTWFAGLIAGELKALGLWHPGELSALAYSDRYLRSPLTVSLAMRSLAGLRKLLAANTSELPLVVTLAPGTVPSGLSPRMLHHDWQDVDECRDVMARFARALSFAPEIRVNGSRHARVLELFFRAASARIYLDQGFGYWRTNGSVRFDFSASTRQQGVALEKLSPFVSGKGKSFIAVTGGTERRQGTEKPGSGQ